LSSVNNVNLFSAHRTRTSSSAAPRLILRCPCDVETVFS
jgi:hypothetical protein